MMNTSLVVTAVIAATVTWIFMYIDARLFDTHKSKLDYLKGMLYVAAVSATIVYFMGSPALPEIGGALPHSTALVSGTGQEMFTGMPSF